MDWQSAINSVLGGNRSPEEAPQEFDKVAQHTPPEVLAGGISEMFRSDQTPSFPEMISNLFRQSNPNQREGLVSQLLGSGGTNWMRELAGAAGLSELKSNSANEVSAEQVQQIAAHAEKQDPSVIDRVSSFYVQHPDVVKAVGGIALGIVLQHMVKRR